MRPWEGSSQRRPVNWDYSCPPGRGPPGRGPPGRTVWVGPAGTRGHRQVTQAEAVWQAEGTVSAGRGQTGAEPNPGPRRPWRGWLEGRRVAGGLGEHLQGLQENLHFHQGPGPSKALRRCNGGQSWH